MSVISSIMRAMHGPIYAARLEELVRQIMPLLQPDDAVLDVGCGFGALGRAILDDSGAPEGITVRGLERFPRDSSLIAIDGYGGGAFPYADRSFDVVILADVLHHEEDPGRLIVECARVARRLVIIKDHKIDGLGAHARISLIDWAANQPYGVKCLYRYNTLAQWHEILRRHDLTVAHEVTSMRLYPPVVNLVFGRRLQYLVVARV